MHKYKVFVLYILLCLIVFVGDFAMGIIRAEVIASMRGAFRQGMSASRFISKMKTAGKAYRKKIMLADWRAINQLEKKKGVIRFIRKDYMPARTEMAEVSWKLSREYMYKVKTESRLRAGEPITERFVNIMSDTPLTPRQVESQVTERWGEWEKYAPEELVGLQVWTAVHRVVE